MSRFGKRVSKPKPPVHEVEALLVGDQKLVACRSLSDVEKELAESRMLCGVEFATHTAKNWGARHENEDRTMTLRHGFGSMTYHTIGVLDGHDTEAASDFVSRQLPVYLEKHLKAGRSVDQAYHHAMSEVEDALKNVAATAGTCVCSCTVAGPYVWCANLGDCRCGLIVMEVPDAPTAHTQVKSVSWMSRDHKASAPEERRRIRDLGGVVTNGRVEGLEPTRTLGDFDVKLQTKPGVISIEPDVRCHRLGDGSSMAQAIIVCATDGVWDAISGQDICDLIHARKEIAALQVALATGAPTRSSSAKPLRDLAEDLVQFAVARGSHDDCTAVVALVSAGPPPK